MSKKALSNAAFVAAKNSDYSADLTRKHPSNIDKASLRYRLLSKATTAITEPPNKTWAAVMKRKINNPAVYRTEEEWDLWEETAKKWRWLCNGCAAWNSCWIVECARCDRRLDARCAVMELAPLCAISVFDEDEDDDTDTVVGVRHVEPDLDFLRKCGCRDVLMLLHGTK
jgi:hypothetical protein